MRRRAPVVGGEQYARLIRSHGWSRFAVLVTLLSCVSPDRAGERAAWQRSATSSGPPPDTALDTGVESPCLFDDGSLTVCAGPHFVVSEPGSVSHHATAASMDDGNFLVAWARGDHVTHREFEVPGEDVRPEATGEEGPDVLDPSGHPEVATDGATQYVVAFEALVPEPVPGTAIRARFLDASGAMTDEIDLHAPEWREGGLPDLATWRTGPYALTYAATWVHDPGALGAASGRPAGQYVTFFDGATGAIMLPPFVYGQTLAGAGGDPPDATPLPDGSVTVAWAKRQPIPPGETFPPSRIMGSRINRAGGVAHFVVHPVSDDQASRPAVAADDLGRTLFVWRGVVLDDNTASLRFVDQHSVPDGPPHPLHPEGTIANRPDVAWSSCGWVIAYERRVDEQMAIAIQVWDYRVEKMPETVFLLPDAPDATNNRVHIDVLERDPGNPRVMLTWTAGQPHTIHGRFVDLVCEAGG